MYDQWFGTPSSCSHPHPAFPVEATSSGGDEVVVGYVTAIAPPQTVPPPCQDALIRSYRGYVLFDISDLQGKANLYAGKATLEFDMTSSQDMNAPPNFSTCVSSLGMVGDPWTPDPTNFEMRHSQPGSSFWRIAQPPPPIPFPQTIQAQTVGSVTETAVGHFTINVDPYVRVWLANNASNHGVVLTSIYETFVPAPPTVNNGCAGRFAHFVLTVFTA
jgi:hypothetical protein